MSDSINSLSPNFRDFLLNRNLITDTVSDNGLEGLLVGIGQPITNIGTPPEAVQPSSNVSNDGELYKDLNVVTNKFQGINNDYQSVDIAYIPPSGPPTSAFIYSSNYTDDNGILEDTVNLPPVRDFSQGGDIRQYNTSFNLYDDADKRTITNLNYIPGPNVKYTNYLDLNSNIINAEIDILGSIFNGQGVGIGQGKGINAIQPTFDLRSTLLGRVLGGTGIISDTPIGQAGAKYLGLALANNAAFGLQKETIGQLNLNPLNLAMNGLDSFIVPNYDITVPQGKLGRVLDFGARVLGFEVPVSLFDRSSSIFSTENPVTNIIRANTQLSNTGKGQVLALFANIKENTYRPGFQDDRIRGGDDQYDENGKRTEKAKKGSNLNANIYAFGTTDGGVLDLLNESPENSPISQSNYKKDGGRGDGFNDSLTFVQNETKEGNNFMWANTGVKAVSENNPVGDGILADGTLNNEKTLLSKTQGLFNSGKMRTLTTGHYANNEPKEEIQTSVNKLGTGGHYKLSKGSGVLTEDAINGKETGNPFCRTWTTHDRYNQVQDMQKHSGVDGNMVYREGLENSVLGSNGFVKIGPYVGDDAGNRESPTNIKNFMFSIENLAWADGDSIAKLLPCEIGPGDPMTNKRGRIMWFPPYDLSVTENISANWESTNFIGRGEPIYTYNNTERTGTLQFKIVVDHPSYLNAIRSESDEYIASFFAGCTDLDPLLAQKLTTLEKNEIETKNVLQPQKSEAAPTPPKVPQFDFFFANDVATLNEEYENAKGSTGLGSIPTTGEFFSKTQWNDKTDFGLNGDESPNILKEYGGWISPEGKAVIKKVLNEECQSCTVEILGHASVAGGTSGSAAKKQNKLSKARAESVKDWFRTQIFSSDTSGLYDKIDMDDRFEEVDGKGASDEDGEKCPTNEIDEETGKKIDTSDYYGCKIHRKTTVRLGFDTVLDAKINKRDKEPKEIPQDFDVNTKIINRFYNECNYFEMLRQEDKFIYDTLKTKLRFFHPAFHAITPEGLNSRLTFLQQCMRQGPTNNVGSASNLAFGRPPVCILRLGDFYYTKIIIDNIGVSYEPLVWDLNPEGIGVQPMIATVDLSFKIIGGQSLKGPVNKLQNAVSFNFFGNTQVYDVRADKIAKSDNIPEDKDESGLAKSVDGTYTLIPGEEVLEPTINRTEVARNPTGSDRTEAELDQIAASELSNTTQEETLNAETIDNNEVIKKIGMSQYKDFKRESITITYFFLQGTDVSLKLNAEGDEYRGEVYIRSSTVGNWHIGSVNIAYNDANSVLITGPNINDKILPSTATVFQLEFDLTYIIDDENFETLRLPFPHVFALVTEWTNKSSSRSGPINFIG